MGNFKSAHIHREAWPLQDQIRRPSSGTARLTPPLTLALLASLSSKNTSYLPCAHIFFYLKRIKNLHVARETLRLFCHKLTALI